LSRNGPCRRNGKAFWMARASRKRVFESLHFFESFRDERPFQPRAANMALVKSELKGEIRIIFFDVQRLIDEASIGQCYREIMELLEKTEEKHVLLHFGRVTFMSSAALGMLVRLQKKCKEYEISLRLCNITPDILQVFKITNLDKFFSISPDASDALEAFKKGGQLFFRKQRETRHDLK
jgi:anti-anti-sigma factor